MKAQSHPSSVRLNLFTQVSHKKHPNPFLAQLILLQKRRSIIQLCKHCTKLRYLNLRGCEAVSDDSMDVLARHCSKIKSLDIGKCDVTDEGLCVLAQNCPQLKKLSLKSCDAITDAGVKFVAKSCRQLQQFNIQDCHLTVDAYRTIKKYCKKCFIEHTNPGFYQFYRNKNIPYLLQHAQVDCYCCFLI